MEILKGTILLLFVLSLFSLFSFKAPNGMKAMGALASAAVASFLVEAFQLYVGGDLIGIPFLKEVGQSSGSLGGVAGATLVALAMGVSPVYAMLVGASVLNFGLLPGFIAGYLISFLVKQIEKRVPEGLDLIACIVIAAPLTRLIAKGMDPIVTVTLKQIGAVITSSTDANPIIMGIILGGIITVVATAPLSSMALTALLGLTGLPMAIGALAVTSSSFMNYVFFKRMKLGDKRTVIAVSIEPLTQADLISANPIPVYVTNFIGGATAGIIISMFDLINNATGTATPIAGLMVMYGFNDPMKVTLCFLCIMVSGILSGYIGSLLFKNYPIRTAEQIRGTDGKAIDAAAS
ncbi:transcriptional regulator [Brevibacillus sp. 7WMA2]|uniref:PTS sugar transporter subunit IIC n=1 Tax=Brevibacillus TaxID=55080 RepID=UPI0003B21733|nr:MULTISPECIES: PTS sugar transporter subunit IIC [Brevibacillus]ERM16556.1 transcriptional regulator [Brevibacillus laterosporus PE36]MCR8997126.1 PTS sugar transporter subunit IIC [Brevibacillus laterosporus]QIC05416.1 transcriptional regulator [Brevibacillus sp. 7WMA2]WPS86248.1 PTS sugar transporter subunit IIC [Brevibacillus halotolerans]